VVAWLNSVAWEEEERVDMWGSHVSDRDERRRCCPKARTHEGNIFRRGARGARAYRAGWVRWRPGKGEWAGVGELGWLGRTQERNQNGNLISNFK
jgi:hypothetical protein